MVDFDAMSVLPYGARLKEFFDYLATRRAREAVGVSDQANVWEVFRHDESIQVLSDHATFTSDKTALIPEDQRRLATAIRGNFTSVDPPLHTKMRAVVNKAFTPRTIADLEPRIRLHATNLLDAALAEAGEGGEFDLGQQFSSQLSAAVIASLFGIPDVDHKRFWSWSDALLGSRPFGDLGSMDEAGMRRIGELIQEAGEYVIGHVQRCRADPGDDLTSRLAHIEVDGKPLEDDEIFGTIGMFLIAGHMSTSLVIGNTMMCLDEHPAAMAEVRADPGLLPKTIEEVLRWRPALVRDQRVARVDTELGGVSIPAGANVCVWLASANRDERHITDGETFDIHRETVPHRTFGHGIHYCLGAPLARLETRIAMELLLTRSSELSVPRDDGVEFHRSIGLLGPIRLPVVFREANR